LVVDSLKINQTLFFLDTRALFAELAAWMLALFTTRHESFLFFRFLLVTEETKGRCSIK
jgi:hypothetical protein